MKSGGAGAGHRVRAMHGMARRASGVTLIELMFALTILAILVALAAPTYREASLAGRLNATASSLHASVLLARSEAIKANAETTLCPSSDGATCAGGGDWDQGWIVLDAEGAVIEQHAAEDTGYKVIQSGGTANLTFQPIGVGSSAG